MPITKDGEISLKKELATLKFEERPKISLAIAEARAHGDLKENAEYHAAKELQGLMEAKISDIESTLSNAQVIDVKEIPESGRVIFGSTVKIINIEDQHETIYKIVGNLESNPDIGNISIETPIAKGLIGKFVDDEVKIIDYLTNLIPNYQNENTSLSVLKKIKNQIKIDKNINTEVKENLLNLLNTEKFSLKTIN